MSFEEIEKIPTEKLHELFANSVLEAGRIKAVLEERLRKAEKAKGEENGTKSKGKRRA
jgi:hypothetical protein